MAVFITPENGYHFNKSGIQKIEEMYGAKYMGYWATKRPNGNWNELPVDVFYQPNPDTEKGHTHYFGMYRQTDVYITDASSAFSDPIYGVDVGGRVLVSRYVHDFSEFNGWFIDGGRDYCRTNIMDYASKRVKITVDKDQFILEKV